MAVGACWGSEWLKERSEIELLEKTPFLNKDYVESQKQSHKRREAFWIDFPLRRKSNMAPISSRFVVVWPVSVLTLCSSSSLPLVLCLWNPTIFLSQDLCIRYFSSLEFFSSDFHMMGLRTCYPRTWLLSILNILNWRSLRKWPKQEGRSDLPSSWLPWNRS